MRHIVLLIILLGCLSCSVGQIERSEIPPNTPPMNGRVPNHLQLHENIYGRNYLINLGPQRVIVNASYREKADSSTDIKDNPLAGDLRHYLDLRATSGLAGTSAVVEGEMAYNTLNSFAEKMRPGMFRFGLKNSWYGLSYGADYKSVAKGFTSLEGKTEGQSRDESLIWGEHRLGPFNLRGTVTQVSEGSIDTTNERVSQTAAAEVHFNRAQWAGAFSAIYGLTGDGIGLNKEHAVFVNTLATSYRPFGSLIFEPNFSFREELNQKTGVRIQTPTSKLMFSFTPLLTNFRLTGVASISQVISNDDPQDVRIYGTSAAMDWKIGNFLGKNDALSLSLNYERQLDFGSRLNSHDTLSSILQLKIAGF
jgi:hypothetical protein